MNTPARPTPGFPQGRQPHFPITLIGVNRPPLVSPRHHMVKGSGIFNSQRARHNPDFNRNPLKRQALIVDCRTDPFTTLSRDKSCREIQSASNGACKTITQITSAPSTANLLCLPPFP
jgi:hypothetical protein